MTDIVLTSLQDDVLLVTLNRPESMNALSLALSRELARVWDRAAQSDVRAVVVTGAGRGFCAGADLRDERTGDVATESLRATYHPHVLAMTALEKPVIAAVNGAAAGAGLSFVFGADLRIAGPGAKLVPAFARLGLVPDTGVGYLAARVLGESQALSWLTGGVPMTAEDGYARGVFELVADDPVATALERAHALAALPGFAYGLTKRMLWAQGRRQLVENLDLEIALQALAVASPERAAARERFVSNMGSAVPAPKEK